MNVWNVFLGFSSSDGLFLFFFRKLAYAVGSKTFIAYRHFLTTLILFCGVRVDKWRKKVFPSLCALSRVQTICFDKPTFCHVFFFFFFQCRVWVHGTSILTSCIKCHTWRYMKASSKSCWIFNCIANLKVVLDIIFCWICCSIDVRALDGPGTLPGTFANLTAKPQYIEFQEIAE